MPKLISLPDDRLIYSDPCKAAKIAREALTIAEDTSDYLTACRCYSIIGLCEMETSNQLKAIQSFENGLVCAARIKSKRAQAVILNSLGNASGKYGNSIKSKNCYVKSRKLAHQIKYFQLYGLATINLATEHAQNGDYSAALVLLLEALLLNEFSIEKEHTSYIYGNLAFLYLVMNDYQRALLYNLKAWEEVKDSEIDLAKAVIASGVGLSYLGLNDPINALPFFHTQLKIAQKLKIPGHHGMALFGIGKVYFQQGHIKLSLQYFSKALIKLKSNSYNLGIFLVLYQTGMAYYFGKNLNKSLEYLGEAVAVAKESSLEGILVPLYKEIGEIFETAGKHTKAATFYSEYIAFEKQFNSIKTKKELINLSKKFDERAFKDIANWNKSYSKDVRDPDLIELSLRFQYQRRILDKIRSEVKNESAGVKSAVEIIRSINEVLSQETELQFIETHLSSEEIEFGKILSNKFPALTRTELKICQFLKIGMTTKSISAFLSITALTVNKHRTSIRKKINIPKKNSLQPFLLNLS